MAEERTAEAQPVTVAQQDDEHNTSTCRCGECWRKRHAERERGQQAEVERRNAEARQRAALTDASIIDGRIAKHREVWLDVHGAAISHERKREHKMLQKTRDEFAEDHARLRSQLSDTLADIATLQAKVDTLKAEQRGSAEVIAAVPLRSRRA
jgi:hypothetical protein